MKFSQKFIIEVIADLKAAQGSNEKVAILKEAIAQTPAFKEFLLATYHPLVRYHIRKIPEYRPNMKGGDFPMTAIFKQGMLDVLSSRKKTGGAAILHLTHLLEALDYRDAEALILLIKRDIDCGVSTGSINKASPDLVPTYPVLLCAQYDEKAAIECFSDGYAFSQLKMDGLRGNVVIHNRTATTFSRNGKELGLDEVFQFIADKLPDGDFVLDGEVVVLDETRTKVLPRKTGNGIINSIAKGGGTPDEKSRVRFVMWDIVPYANFASAKEYAVGYEDRYNQLVKLHDTIRSPQLAVVETRIVRSLREAKEHLQSALERKEEGTILKKRKGTWKPGRFPTQLKMKLILEGDFKITKLIEGSGKYVGKLGAFEAESSCGIVRVRFGSGLSDKQREDFWAMGDALIGKIMAGEFNELIQTDGAEFWSLFLPIFVEVRFDKTEANSFEELQRIQEAARNLKQ
jgi:DNA ligase-1